MLAHRREARIARMDVKQRGDEVASLRAEVQRLRSELHQSQSAQMVASVQVKVRDLLAAQRGRSIATRVI